MLSMWVATRGPAARPLLLLMTVATIASALVPEQKPPTLRDLSDHATAMQHSVILDTQPVFRVFQLSVKREIAALLL